ncbi:MAG: N-6 DNA methylase [Prevotella sp.]|nr:N-6 DNA methylase [Prevotella sp.]
METDYQALHKYIDEVNQKLKSGDAREHTYRAPLENFLQALLGKGYHTLNEPSRIECGNPDIHIRNKDNITVAIIETKDINSGDLDGTTRNQAQFDRYKRAISHCIFTDYLDFHFFENGEAEPMKTIRIATVQGKKAVMDEEKGEELVAFLKTYIADSIPQITSAKKLADLMARKARLMYSVIIDIFDHETDNKERGLLLHFYEELRDSLVPSLDTKGFAKVYSQTVAYGLFAARLHDPTTEDFSRGEATHLIPKTNPFLRGIFNDLAGNNIHPRISWIVDDLVRMFAATDLQRMFERDAKQNRDPLIHFYEDFLAAFDPQDKKTFGVWYTPLEVVRFIVNAVDYTLKTKFGIEDGLADNHKTINKLTHEKEETPLVQILDPATGTGTFLAEVVNHVAEHFQGQQMLWQKYVHENLLPRLYGFEIQMASYTVAHVKLDLVLRNTGYDVMPNDRFNVCMTDSLTGDSPNSEGNANYWIKSELEEANKIKSQKPIMVMVGNPPYNGESQNKGDNYKDIAKLLNDYKREPGKNHHIDDTKWLNNDYVKFIRLAQRFIEDKGEGVIGFINPHSYLDSLTFRGMRYELLKTFDEIYILDLHGNSKTRETSLGDVKDENVFDILPGVCINIFVKKATTEGGKGKEGLARVYHADLYGRRKDKLEYLATHGIEDIPFKEVEIHAPMYFFVPIDFTHEEEYYSGFSPKELFKIGGVGVCSKRDSIAFQHTKEQIKRVVEDFYNLPETDIKRIYRIERESRDQQVSLAKANIVSYGLKEEYYREVLYRPFDKKFTYYTDKSKGFIAYPVYDVMKHLTHHDPSKNLSLITWSAGKDVGNMTWNLAFVSDTIVDLHVFYRGAYIYPLYVRPGQETHYTDNSTEVELGHGQEEHKMLIPNFCPEVVARIAKALGKQPSPEELLDYIYAVLHSPRYRERYKEFLKRDFPRIPYPTNAQSFDALALTGHALRELHLMQDASSWKAHKLFPCVGKGSNIIERREWRDGRVYINDTQYYNNVSEEMWNFYIGGYQVADKWLKDHARQELRLDDVIHYSNILYAINETIRLMGNLLTR